MLEYRSPTPLSEGDPGKDARLPAELSKPEGGDLEFSSNSNVGSESDVKITGASSLPPAGGLVKKKRCAVRKIPISRIEAA